MFKKLTDRIPDKTVRLAGWVIFVIWLVSWAYSASKMLAFKDIGFRQVSLPLEIIALNLWAICFYVKATRAFASGNSPLEALIQKNAAVGQVNLGAIRKGAAAIPLGFAIVLGVMYFGMMPLGSKDHPDWPSASMPAEITFAPMVFFFAGSSFGMNRFQDRLAKQAQAMLADEKA